jgi:cytochrome d ubiquinol oxidase subunit I
MAGLVAAVLVAFPTGDQQAKMVARHQEPALAAMEGRFETGAMAEITLIGQPNVKERRLDNPIKIPGALSFLAYGTFHSEVRGLDAFPPENWPPNIELLYYAFHIMAGLGTIFIVIMGLATLQRLRAPWSRIVRCSGRSCWRFPFPFIANTAGWLTTELGRQPWLILMGCFARRTATATSSARENVLFTLNRIDGPLLSSCGLLVSVHVGQRNCCTVPSPVTTGCAHG